MGGGNGCWECNDASHEQQLTDCHCNCHADEQMEIDAPQDHPIAQNQMNSGTRSDYFVRIGEHGRPIRRSNQVLAPPAQDDVAPPSLAIQVLNCPPQPERGSSSTSSEYGFSFFSFHHFALHKAHLKMKHKHKRGRGHGHGYGHCHGHEQSHGYGHGHGRGYGHGEHHLRLPHHHGKHGHHHKKSAMLKLKVGRGRHFAQPNLQELLTCGRRAMSGRP